MTWTARPDGQLNRVSNRWNVWTGTTGLGGSWVEAIHPEDREASLRAWGQSVAAGEPYDIEHRVKMLDGSYRWMHSRAFPRRDDGGPIVKWYGTTEDIHDRKLAERALAAEAAERNAILGQLAAGRIHAQVLADFPDLEPEDITAALEYAAAAVQDRELPIVRSA